MPTPKRRSLREGVPDRVIASVVASLGTINPRDRNGGMCEKFAENEKLVSLFYCKVPNFTKCGNFVIKFVLKFVLW